MELLHVIMENAAAGIGMTLEQAIKEAVNGRVLCAFKFILLQQETEVNGARRSSTRPRKVATAVGNDGQIDTGSESVSV